MNITEEQKLMHNLRLLIKLHLSKNILDKLSSSLTNIKYFKEPIIPLFSEITNIKYQNIHKHFNGEQKFDAIDLLKYWQAYSKIWDKYAKEDQIKLSLDTLIENYNDYFSLISSSYIETPQTLALEYPQILLDLIITYNHIEKKDSLKKNPLLKQNHINTINYFKNETIIKQKFEQYKLKNQEQRRERMKDYE